MEYQDEAPEMEAVEAEPISPEEFIGYALAAENLAAEMEDAQLAEISAQVIADYDMDKESMSEWFERMERGLKLAQLVKEDKNYPFDGAANVKYPLVTSAALQFNARAYPAIVPTDRVVLAKVWGADKGGKKAARAERVSEYMSWQLSAEIKEWEEDTDKMLVMLPIVGTSIRKWWYDPVEARTRCRTIEPGKFIVNDKVKNLHDAPRATEELPLYPSEIDGRVNSKFFVPFEYDTTGEDKMEPHDFIEQHTRLDLDEDGYAEPYVVTVHIETKTVVRIVADFAEADVNYKRETQQVIVQQPAMGIYGPVMVDQIAEQEVITGIISIKRGSYFIAYQFLPSMDGGFHGTGLGLLLGDISDSINTIINMMLDAGHYASLGGGFIGSDFRMKGGSNRFKPGEWKQVQSSGGDVKNGMVPVTFPGPDGTLFQMLGLLIDAGREIASVKDTVTGEAPRQQQTATTTLALIEQGMMVFTAAYKRIFRSLKQEYSLLASLNVNNVDPEKYAAFHDEHAPEQEQQMLGHNGGPQFTPESDFGSADMDIQPVADPRSVTKMQMAAKAQLIMQLAEQGLVDRGEAMTRIAEAMDIEDVETLLPKPDPMAEQMGQMQMQAAQADLMEKTAKIELILAQVEETRAKAMEAMAGAESDAVKAQNDTTRVRMDALKTLLEDERAGIDRIIRGVGGMAGASGNGGSTRSNGVAGAAPQGVDLSGLLGG